MATFLEGSELLVPEGTRVLHIGPHKTGTTSLQSAFHACRDAVMEQGVHYAGRGRHPMGAVLAAIGHSSPRHDDHTPPDTRKWERILREIHTTDAPRVLLSSEFFADARNRSIRSVIEQVGAEQVHVVVTLRPLAKIIPSQWQQYVQSGATMPFDEWLTTIFENPETAAKFWRRHRHDRLIERWAAVVGDDRVTAVVVDDSDHDSVLRSFEQIMGLRTGTLVADRSLVNRSLMRGEVEAVRAFNVEFWNAHLPRSLHTRLIRSGASHYLQARKPEPDEDKVLMPRWALDRACAVTDEIIAGITATNITVTGDLDLLRQQPRSQETAGQQAPPTVTPEVAARFARGVLVAADVLSAPSERLAPPRTPPNTAEATRRKTAKKALRDQARVAALSPPRRYAVRVLRYLSRKTARAEKRVRKG